MIHGINSHILTCCPIMVSFYQLQEVSKPSLDDVFETIETKISCRRKNAYAFTMTLRIKYNICAVKPKNLVVLFFCSVSQKCAATSILHEIRPHESPEKKYIMISKSETHRVDRDVQPITMQPTTNLSIPSSSIQPDQPHIPKKRETEQCRIYTLEI